MLINVKKYCYCCLSVFGLTFNQQFNQLKQTDIDD